MESGEWCLSFKSINILGLMIVLLESIMNDSLRVNRFHLWGCKDCGWLEKGEWIYTNVLVVVGIK